MKRLFLGIACLLVFVAAINTTAQTTYTWTNNAAGTFDWTTAGNWDSGTTFVSGSNNELRFFPLADFGSTAVPGTRTINNIPSFLSMNVLSLRGAGSNGGFPSYVYIGDGSSTWTLGDGSISAVEVAARHFSTTDRTILYTVAPSIILNHTNTTFTGRNDSYGIGVQHASGGYVFSGNITEAAAGYGITIDDTCMIIFTGTNSYSGATRINGGTLRIGGESALPGGVGVSGGASSLILNGGVMELPGGSFLRDLGSGSNQFQVVGGTSGFSARGAPAYIAVNDDADTALTWNSGSFSPSLLVLNRSWTGDSALTLGNGIDLDGNTAGIQANAGVARIAGDIVDTSGSGGLTKEGSGMLHLTGNNTYTGDTTISGGILSGGPNNSLGDASSDIVFNGGSLRINGTSVTNIATLGHSVSFNNNKTAGFAIADADNTFTVEQAMYLGSGQFLKYGEGTLVLKGANTITGYNYVYGGTLVLDYSTEDNAKLANNRLYLYGDIVLRGGSHSETVSATFANAAHNSAAISRDGGTATLDLGTVAFGENSSLSISGNNIAKTSTTTANGIFYFGRATVSSNFATRSGSDIVAYTNYTIYSDGGGGGDYTTVNEWRGDGALGSTLLSYALKIANTGDGDVLDVGSYNLYVENGGQDGSTYLYAGGHDNNFTINGMGRMATKNSNRGMQINVFTGTLTVNCKMKNGGNSALTKTGVGTLVAGGANDYSAPTRVSEGILRLATDTAAGTTAGGIYVKSDAALELTNSIDIGTEALNLAGTGISNGGCVRSVSGDNACAGSITVDDDARINVDSGTLLLSGDITGPAKDIVFGGAGNLTLSNSTVLVAGVSKDGAGTLSVVVDDTSDTQWTCGKMSMNSSTLALTFNDAPSESVPLIKVMGDVSFNGTPALQLVLDSDDITTGTLYPLIEVAGSAPTIEPLVMGFTASTKWSGPGKRTLYLDTSPSGTVLLLR